MELELEYFEQVQASPALTLLRVAGTWPEGEPASAPVLAVLNGSSRRDVPALPATADAEPEESAWRAAFGVPADAVRENTRFRLLVGAEEIDLPPPRDREDEPEPEPAPAPAEPDPEPPRPARRRPDPEPISVTPATVEVPPEPYPRRRLLAAVLVLVLVGVGGAWIAGAFKGDDSRSAAPRSATTQAGARTTPAAHPPVPLVPIAGLKSAARGDAVLDGRHLAMSLKNLGPGVFQAWAYNDVIDAAPLGAPVKGPAGFVDARIPAGNRYRYIDVSREGDKNPGHSGRSVLRIPLAALRRSGSASPGR